MRRGESKNAVICAQTHKSRHFFETLFKYKGIQIAGGEGEFQPDFFSVKILQGFIKIHGPFDAVAEKRPGFPQQSQSPSIADGCL